jgi:electron transfer flavoprotein alpha/beta subunit
VRSLTEVLGEGLATLGGWQSVAAVAELASSDTGTAIVETVGLNEQAVAAVFRRG